MVRWTYIRVIGVRVGSCEDADYCTNADVEANLTAMATMCIKTTYLATSGLSAALGTRCCPSLVGRGLGRWACVLDLNWYC